MKVIESIRNMTGMEEAPASSLVSASARQENGMIIFVAST